MYYICTHMQTDGFKPTCMHKQPPSPPKLTVGFDGLHFKVGKSAVRIDTFQLVLVLWQKCNDAVYSFSCSL